MRASTRFARPASRSGCQVRDADPARSPRPAVPSLADPPDPPRSTQTRLRVLHLLDEAYISGAREVREPPGRARFSNLGTPHPRRGLERDRSKLRQPPPPPAAAPHPPQPLHPQPPILSQVHLDRIAAGLFAPRDPGDPVAAAAAARSSASASPRRGWRFANRILPPMARRAGSHPPRGEGAPRRGSRAPAAAPPDDRRRAGFETPGATNAAAAAAAPSGHRSEVALRAPRDRAPRRRPPPRPRARPGRAHAGGHGARPPRGDAQGAQRHRRARGGEKTAARGGPRPVRHRRASVLRALACGARRGRARTARGPTSKKPTRVGGGSSGGVRDAWVVFPARGTRRGGTPTRRGSRG